MLQENISNTNGLSALEKAQLLKRQREEQKQTEKLLTEKEQALRQKELDEKYLVNKEEHEGLLKEKQEKDTDLKTTRDRRLENIQGQRAAIKEMVGDEEGKKLFNEYKKDIFGEDEESLKNIKTKEKGLKEEVGDLGDRISSKEKVLKEQYEETTEGKAKKEKEEKEREEKGKKEATEKVVLELMDKVNNSIEDFLKKQEEAFNNILNSIEGLKGSQNEQDLEILSDSIVKKISEFPSDTRAKENELSSYIGEAQLPFVGDEMRVKSLMSKLATLNLNSKGSELWTKFNLVNGKIREEIRNIEEENEKYNRLPQIKRLTTKRPISKAEFFKKMNEKRGEA